MKKSVQEAKEKLVKAEAHWWAKEYSWKYNAGSLSDVKEASAKVVEAKKELDELL